MKFQSAMFMLASILFCCLQFTEGGISVGVTSAPPLTGNIGNIGTRGSSDPIYVAPPTQTMDNDLAIMRYIASIMFNVEKSWDPTGDPCLSQAWAGVVCNSNGAIKSIDLTNKNLNLPIQVFANISYLNQIEVISLSNTGVNGYLPEIWGQAITLKNIDLSGNANLAGQWPSSWNFKTLPNLSRFNTTFTGITKSWAYFCEPLPNPSLYYYKSPCLGKGTTQAGKNLISVPSYDKCDNSPVADGFYVSSFCQPGTFDAVGNNRVVARCSTPSAGQFVVTPCQQGSSTRSGADTVLALCRSVTPAANEYVRTCVAGTYNMAGSDSIALPCTMPVAGSTYVSAVCFQGSQFFNIAGRDAVLKQCDNSEIVGGKFVSSVCDPGSAFFVGSNRILSTCAVPKVNEFVAGACLAGSSMEVGTNTDIQACSTPMSGEYVSATCISGSAYVEGADTILKSCGAFDPSQKLISPCFQGAPNLLGSPNVVKVSVNNGSKSDSTLVVVGTAFAFLFAFIGILGYVHMRRNPETMKRFNTGHITVVVKDAVHIIMEQKEDGIPPVDVEKGTGGDEKEKEIPKHVTAENEIPKSVPMNVGGGMEVQSTPVEPEPATYRASGRRIVRSNRRTASGDIPSVA